MSGSADDVFHLKVLHDDRWPKDYCCSELNNTALKPAGTLAKAVQVKSKESMLEISGKGELTLRNAQKKIVLRSAPDQSFGVCGNAWLFQFVQQRTMQFYGLGENNRPFEKSGTTNKFWNTDAFGDFSVNDVVQCKYDPDYISIPYCIIKQGNEYCAVLVDNPFPSVVRISHRHEDLQKDKSAGVDQPRFYAGAENGPASLYILYGPTLHDLVCKFQKLTGVLPLPPLWGLGNHQCRWGYKSYDELKTLADTFEKHRFPLDGLWLDIDYMDGYRVFTFDKKHFSAPARQIGELVKRGYKVIPIIDPGVKWEARERNNLFDTGSQKEVFCKNAAGTDFVGIVWPGNTVFPDFSLPVTQAWWAEQVAEFAQKNIYGAWIDMNDPSTGFIECTGMLFDKGRVSHDAYHNQYALLMAKATKAGFLKAHPDKRPFVISRSGFTGQQKFSGNWTGDSASNYIHLQACIAKSLNLAMSGVVFNGGDIGGFMGSTNESLLIDWYKTEFLFPLMRNHTESNSCAQEPWAFSKKALDIMRYYTRLRYKLLPYLYNLFVCHEQTGEAVLRPLMYDFNDAAALPLGTIDDQFMVGPSIMQAPFVREKQLKRTIVLPAATWFQAERGAWVKGNRTITVAKESKTTPLFFREGALIPMQAGTRFDNRNNLKDIELLIVATNAFKGKGVFEYSVDDGQSFGYRKGERSTYAISFSVKNKHLVVVVNQRSAGFGEVTFTPVTLDRFTSCVMISDGVERNCSPAVKTINHFGASYPVTFWS